MHQKKGAADEPTPIPISTRVEKKQVEERLAIGPHVVYETIRREGEEELHRTVSALAWSGFAAGLSMGFSFISEALLMSHLPDAPWRPLISKLGYAVGFLIVVLGRQQLFTENTLTVVLPLLLRKDMETLYRMLRLWGVVLCANLVGTFLFALCLAKIAVLEPHAQAYLAALGAAHIGTSFGIALMRSIFAGWLIALMVWLLPAAEASRVWIIILLTYLIGLGGFNHIIAGSTTVFFLVITHGISWGTYFTQFFVPALIGNVIGGFSLVAALGHVQVVGGREE
ncbi:MAG TPA: formate/nitrite transporter family protein [Verrucomicrobiae bacterium]|jgi:formate-nitrite transporter family protein|nr:formate/nitrite transporter family protein [Verrucomicrobiae bacterium]